MARKRSLSLWGNVKFVYYILLVAVTGFLVNAVQLVSLVVLYPFSLKLYRLFNKFLLDLHFPLYPYGSSYFGRCPMTFAGDVVPKGEGAVCLINHPSTVDWIFGFQYAMSKDSLGSMKVIVKDEMKWLPVFGCNIWCNEFIFVKRKNNWEHDQITLNSGMKQLVSYPGNFWCIIFPEGTNFKAYKRESSQKFARENNLPLLEHLLNPRSKAFYLMMKELRGRFEYIYDGSLFYFKDTPTLGQLLAGDEEFPVCLHVRRIPICEVPEDMAGLDAWLQERYRIKDKMFEYALKNGRFEDPLVDCPLNPWFMHGMFLGWNAVFVLQLLAGYRMAAWAVAAACASIF